METIFDYMPSIASNQIFTPADVANKQLDKLEEMDKDIFSDPNKTFIDLYSKSGIYIAMIVKRLYKGLATVYPDNIERIKHILKYQVYSFSPNTILYSITNRYVYGFLKDNDKVVENKHIAVLDTLKLFKEKSTADAVNSIRDYCMKNYSMEDTKYLFKGGNELKFDVVVGNPPYQENLIDTSDKPVYPLFYDVAREISNMYALITPGRWLFDAGKTSHDWNKKMINDEHLRVGFYEADSTKIFNGVAIAGGVTIIEYDANNKIGPIKLYTKSEELGTILNKVIESSDFKSIQEIIYGDSKFNLNALYKEYPSAKGKFGLKGRGRELTSPIFTQFPELFKTEEFNESIKIEGVIKNKKAQRWIDKKYLDFKETNINQYKVLLPASNGSGALGEGLSTVLIGKPFTSGSLVGYTQTYISFGSYDNIDEANATMKYLKTKFARCLVGVLKVTQHNKRKVWKYVPIQDFTKDSDIDWTQSIDGIDQQLYTKYNLDKNEIDFIERNIKSM